MSLADKLAATRAASEKRIPPDRAAIMERATENLRRSGILDRIVKVGSPAPAFELAGHERTARRRTDGGLVLPRIVVTLLPA